MVGAERLERLAHRQDAVVVGQARGGRRLGLGVLTSRPLSPQPVQGARAHDGGQPGPRSAAGGVVAAGLVPGLEERLLHHVFGIARLAQDAQGDPVRQGGVRVVELGEGRRVAFGQAAQHGRDDKSAGRVRRVLPRMRPLLHALLVMAVGLPAAAQDVPGGAPPPAGEGAGTGVGVHELLPGIGKLGAQVGFSMGRSGTPTRSAAA
jgi:hypothetical protein